MRTITGILILALLCVSMPAQAQPWDLAARGLTLVSMTDTAAISINACLSVCCSYGYEEVCRIVTVGGWPYERCGPELVCLECCGVP